jgi:polysaccharide pyruvyl transferase WcaK-like protein
MLKNKLFALKLFAKEFFKRIVLLIFNKKEKNIGYIGGHGFKNLGDDVMYFAMQRSFPKYNIVTFQTVGVEKLLSIFGLSGKKFFKLIVFGGGTLINEMWFNKVERSLGFNLPIIALGTGVGSCGLEQSHQINFSNWTNVLNKFRFVGVRGLQSQNRLDGINVRSNIVGDLALLLSTEEPKKAFKKRIGLNLMDIPEYNKYWEAVIPTLLELKAKGWEFEPLVMNPNDLIYTKEFFKKLHLEMEIDVLESFDQFVIKSNELAFTICVRLHGSVLSVCDNIPTILFGYRDKCKDFMYSVDLDDYYIDLDTDKADELAVNEKIYALVNKDKNNQHRNTILNKALYYKNKITDALHSNLYK